MPGQAIAACAAGHRVRGENPVADVKILDALAHFDNFPGDLVAQHQRRLLDAVPFHQVAAADAARAYAHEQLTGADPGNWEFLKAKVPVIVVHRDAHKLCFGLRVSSYELRVSRNFAPRMPDLRK